MSLNLLVSLIAVFAFVALASAVAASRVLTWAAPERRRLRELTTTPTGVLRDDAQLVDVPDPALGRLSKALPKSARRMSRLRRQLAAAGSYDLSAAVYYSAARVAAPLLFAALALLTLGPRDGLVLAGLGAIIGFLLPDVVLARRIRQRMKAIERGLPDALDLLVICIEAGCSLDQGIVRAGEELEVSHPELAKELHLVTTEIRAGKPRLEAFRNFASRTRVDDVRALVAMLTQTDRFGTSVGQALRIQADVSRTKRRQRAEERAAKIGVKLVFPLALCVFPAVYLVCIGPAVVAIYRAFF